jgi:hypothetical protein
MKSRRKRHNYSHGQWALTIIVFFCFTSLSCAMGTKGEKQPPAVSDDKSNSQKIVLVEILSNADSYNAKVVKVAGVFKGWKGTCGSSFSITRSDWILGDGPDCIYVSGLLPSGLSTARPGNERVEVTGKVKVAADGKVHLKAMKIKVCQ